MIKWFEKVCILSLQVLNRRCQFCHLVHPLSPTIMEFNSTGWPGKELYNGFGVCHIFPLSRCVSIDSLCLVSTSWDLVYITIRFYNRFHYFPLDVPLNSGLNGNKYTLCNSPQAPEKIFLGPRMVLCFNFVYLHQYHEFLHNTFLFILCAYPGVDEIIVAIAAA
jgi:hypothetical protein